MSKGEMSGSRGSSRVIDAR